MTQTSFLSVVCNRTKPPPATADAEFIGIDDTSTERYLCKGQSKGAYLPATEWICARLGAACGLPIPPVSVIELSNQPGIYYFGSQWLGGAVDVLSAIDRVSNPDVFAKTLAVDLFAHNVDRHLGNYLYLDIAGDVVARIIDFSRAWYFSGWPLPPLPLPGHCNTIRCLPHWMLKYGGQYAKPTAVLQQIAELPDEWMRETLSTMPGAWLSKTEQIALRQWWVSKARLTRITSAMQNLP